MNSFMNEDLMWERLKDMQHEVENRRSGGRRWVPTARFVAERAWPLAGLASRRAPRRAPRRRPAL